MAYLDNLAAILAENPIHLQSRPRTPLEALLSGFAQTGPNAWAKRRFASSPDNPSNLLADLATAPDDEAFDQRFASVATNPRATDPVRDAASTLAQHRHRRAEEKRLANEANKPKPERPARYLSPSDAAAFELPLSVTTTPIEELPPNILARLAPKKQENGGLSAADLDGPTLDMVARTYLQTGQLPPLGMGAAGVRTQILKRAAQLSPNADIGGAAAGFTADKQSLAAIQKQMDAVQSFKNTAKANAQLMLKLAAKIPDTGSPLTNQILRAAQSKIVGDADVQNFRTSLAVFQPEAARILNNPNLAGQLTDSARQELQALINGSFTMPQLQGAVNTLNQDFANRETSLAQQKSLIEGRIGSRRGVPVSTGKDRAGSFLDGMGLGK